MTLTVHRYRPRDGFQQLAAVDPGGAWELRTFDGRPLNPDWRAPGLKMVETDEAGRALRESDFPHLDSHVLVVSARAAKLLEDVLLEAGELRPVRVGAREFYLLNTQRLIQAIDEERSAIKRFPDGRVLNVERYEFLPGALVGVGIFKLVSMPLGSVYFTSGVVELIAGFGLVGFGSVEVWRQSQ